MAWVRRRSSAFSRGRSRFRGVSGQAGHWEARIGTFGDRKNASSNPLPSHAVSNFAVLPLGCMQCR